MLQQLLPLEQLGGAGDVHLLGQARIVAIY